MFKLLKRLKVIHPMTGCIIGLTGFASNHNYITAVGLGILLLCLIKE